MKILLGMIASLLFISVQPVRSENMTILTENLPPLNYVEDGVLVGPSVEIVREIQRRVGSNEQIEVYPWARAYKMALEEENVVLFSMSSVCELPSMIQGSRRQIGRPLKRS